MKTLILLLMPFISYSQISIQMRAGCTATLSNPFLAIAPHLAAHNIALTPEMIINVRDNEPVDMGLKISYQYKFIEAGVGRYANLYSLDGVNNHGQQSNGWSNLYFVQLHWKKYFFEYDYMNGSKFGIGVRQTIANILN